MTCYVSIPVSLDHSNVYTLSLASYCATGMETTSTQNVLPAGFTTGSLLRQSPGIRALPGIDMRVPPTPALCSQNAWCKKITRGPIDFSIPYYHVIGQRRHDAPSSCSIIIPHDVRIRLAVTGWDSASSFHSSSRTICLITPLSNMSRINRLTGNLNAWLSRIHKSFRNNLVELKTSGSFTLILYMCQLLHRHKLTPLTYAILQLLALLIRYYQDRPLA